MILAPPAVTRAGLADLAGEADRALGGQYTGSGVSTGGSWYLATAGLTRALGMEVDRIRWVPSQAGAPTRRHQRESAANIRAYRPLLAAVRAMRRPSMSTVRTRRQRASSSASRRAVICSSVIDGLSAGRTG